jgi:hypothetical protein
MKYELNLKSEEITLILSALAYDTQGKHGGGRGEATASLINKIKSQAVDSTLTGKAGK